MNRVRNLSCTPGVKMGGKFETPVGYPLETGSHMIEKEKLEVHGLKVREREVCSAMRCALAAT